ncbi:hypothetical protein AKG98_3643 [Moritella sp. JT01]|nr:hypothetical protein AKG98_3643 [Moritella sp. JT01]
MNSSGCISNDFARLYCQCLDAKCSHTLNAAANIVDQLLVDRVRQMPMERQRELFSLV